MSRQLIHIVGPDSPARTWLAQALMHALQSARTAGTLVEPAEAEQVSNTTLRDHIGLGRVALVLADAAHPRHADLQGQDLCITLVLSAEAITPEVDWLAGRTVFRAAGDGSGA